MGVWAMAPKEPAGESIGNAISCFLFCLFFSTIAASANETEKSGYLYIALHLCM